ncbi:hypothetical protein [Segetibacter sp. 3557_3]|uniref:hypothetical protein n=1 Tax=Segetibacter sp. 3557_3 TaxID=2547429 RepID=UPI00140444EF|nr:hypothetical protein [Segetibacter sp. 3557_3]
MKDGQHKKQKPYHIGVVSVVRTRDSKMEVSATHHKAVCAAAAPLFIRQFKG